MFAHEFKGKRTGHRTRKGRVRSAPKRTNYKKAFNQSTERADKMDKDRLEALDFAQNEYWHSFEIAMEEQDRLEWKVYDNW